MHLPIKFINQVFKQSLIDELYLLVLLKNRYKCIGAGWVSKEELIQLFLCKCKTKKTVDRWIRRLVGLGYLKYRNGNYHVKALWRILNEQMFFTARHEVVEVEEKHLESKAAFKIFCFNVCSQKQIQENWRRRFDKKYRVLGKRSNDRNTRYKTDPKSYSVSVGNEWWTKSAGEYSLRLAAKELEISVAEAGRLQIRSEKIGWSRRKQLFNQTVDELNLKTENEVLTFIEGCGNKDIHGRRMVKMGDRYRMRETMFVEYQNSFKYKRYKTVKSWSHLIV